MLAVDVKDVSKSFGETQAVDRVTFTVEIGEIFGLLGPNGAGKTTLIRMILDLFKPDTGQIVVLDSTMSEAKHNRIGYMPEERGLYQDVPLERCLAYLGTLKGLDRAEAQAQSQIWLERFDLTAHRQKKVKDLSKGMQQKAQLIVTLMHKPELIIIDEPFTGLDPVNTQMVKDLLRELRDQGTTIIMSTHQMHQVEEMCDRILLINQGQRLLYGQLAEIRQRFSGHAVLVRTSRALANIPGVRHNEPQNGDLHLTLEPDATPQNVLQALIQQDVDLNYFEVAIPTLDEIFIRVVQGEEDNV